MEFEEVCKIVSNNWVPSEDDLSDQDIDELSNYLKLSDSDDSFSETESVPEDERELYCMEKLEDIEHEFLIISTVWDFAFGKIFRG